MSSSSLPVQSCSLNVPPLGTIGEGERLGRLGQTRAGGLLATPTNHVCTVLRASASKDRIYIIAAANYYVDTSVAWYVEQ